jgi:hypothetical protein
MNPIPETLRIVGVWGAFNRRLGSASKKHFDPIKTTLLGLQSKEVQQKNINLRFEINEFLALTNSAPLPFRISNFSVVSIFLICVLADGPTTTLTSWPCSIKIS